MQDCEKPGLNHCHRALPGFHPRRPRVRKLSGRENDTFLHLRPGQIPSEIREAIIQLIVWFSRGPELFVPFYQRSLSGRRNDYAKICFLTNSAELRFTSFPLSGSLLFCIRWGRLPDFFVSGSKSERIFAGWYADIHDRLSVGSRTPCNNYPASGRDRAFR